ncbi:MAG: peroxide stress protein YaaA [Actinomycetota bacterium]|nr:peroxide stress protein YaaA [Actinomycetota bacterium]
MLRLPPGLTGEVARNALLRDASTAPVRALYTGVLYEALALATLNPAARRRAERTVVVVSALFGALRLADPVPAYRLSMAVRLPGIGPVAALWRAVLDSELAPGAGRRGAVVDQSSAEYVTAWRPRGDLARRWVAVHLVRDRDGVRSVVSHSAKQTRGEVARHLLRTGAAQVSVHDVAEALRGRFDAELGRPARPGAPWRLDVVLRD